MPVNIPGLSVFGGPPLDDIQTTGQIFWVGATVAAPGGVVGVNLAGKWGGFATQPFATIDFAVGQCIANRGDVIIVMPGHAENISAATSLVIDVAGVRIIGLGWGRTRPVLTFTNTAGSIEMDAADCSLENIVFFASVSAVVVGINVDAADCSIVGCEFDFDATADDFVTMIDVDTFDRAKIKDCRFIAENGTTGCAEAIRLDTAHETVIENNRFTGDFTDAVIVLEGAASNSVEIGPNKMWNGHANNRYIVNSIASDGLFDDNVVGFEDAQAHANTMITTQGAATLNWQTAVHRSSVFDGGTTNSHGDLAGTNDPYTIFTVTGDIIIQAIWGVCNTDLTGATGTISVGVTGNTASLIALETATEIDDGGIYVSATQAVGAAGVAQTAIVALNDGLDIIETPLTANITGGQIDYYCIWAPVEDGALLISAAATT